MKELLKRDSKLRRGQCEEPVEGQVEAEALFHHRAVVPNGSGRGKLTAYDHPELTSAADTRRAFLRRQAATYSVNAILGSGKPDPVS
jgi:hypothetical protein